MAWRWRDVLVETPARRRQVASHRPGKSRFSYRKTTFFVDDASQFPALKRRFFANRRRKKTSLRTRPESPVPSVARHMRLVIVAALQQLDPTVRE